MVNLLVNQLLKALAVTHWIFHEASAFTNSTSEVIDALKNGLTMHLFHLFVVTLQKRVLHPSGVFKRAYPGFPRRRRQRGNECRKGGSVQLHRVCMCAFVCARVHIPVDLYVLIHAWIYLCIHISTAPLRINSSPTLPKHTCTRQAQVSEALTETTFPKFTKHWEIKCFVYRQ